MKAPRILLVTRALDDRHIGGSAMRLGTLRRALSQVGEVTVALLDQWPPDRPRGAADSATLHEPVVILRRKSRHLPERLIVLGALLGARSGRLDRLLQGNWTPAEGEQIEGFDLIWYFRTIAFMRYPPVGFDGPVIVDFDDLEENGRGPQGSLVRRADRRASTALRARIAARCATVTVCSDADRRRLSLRNAEVVPNSVAIPDAAGLSPIPNAANLLFVGRLGYPPNRAGIIWFASRVLPIIQCALPEARLRVVGPEPLALPAGIRNAVDAVGPVPDLAEHYAWARLAIAPILSGSGTRLKVLEAMSYGRPVASTTVGAEGIDIEAGRDILIGDDPGTMASACIDLLTDMRLAQTVADHGRRLVCTRYDSASVEARVADVARRALEAASTHHR